VLGLGHLYLFGCCSRDFGIGESALSRELLMSTVFMLNIHDDGDLNSPALLPTVFPLLCNGSGLFPSSALLGSPPNRPSSLSDRTVLPRLETACDAFVGPTTKTSMPTSTEPWPPSSTPLPLRTRRLAELRMPSASEVSTVVEPRLLVSLVQNP